MLFWKYLGKYKSITAPEGRGLGLSLQLLACRPMGSEIDSGLAHVH